MHTELIFSNIAKHISLEKEEKKHFAELLHERVLPKNQLVLRQGERCQQLYFVNAGILRAFYINEQGKEATMMFAMEDWWITDMYCFLNELPAMVNIQVVESACVLGLSKGSLDQLYQDIPKFNTFFRILMQNAYCREQLRMMQRLSLPAKDRYEEFLEKYPKLASQVSLKQIASYLGITPEFLSYIRAK